MSSDDLVKIILALFATGGPIGVLFAAYKGGCDRCCQERDEYRKVNDAALEASKKLEKEMTEWAWKLTREAGGRERP